MTRYLLTVATLVCLALLIACGGDGDSGGGADAGGDGTASSGQSQGGDDEGSSTVNDADLSEIDACGLLTRQEVEAAVGNTVEDGAEDFGTSCKWDGEAAETSVSLYFREVPGELCEQALTTDDTYAEATGFGSPAFTSYNDAGNVGQTDVVVCLANGQMQLIVTGGFEATTPEAELRQAAEDLTKLVLSRI